MSHLGAQGIEYLHLCLLPFQGFAVGPLHYQFMALGANQGAGSSVGSVALLG